MERPVGEQPAPRQPASRPATSSMAASTAKDGSNADVFDYDTSLARLGGDRHLFLDILDIFLEDAPAMLEQAADALGRGESAAVARAAHTLQGMSANFAAASAVAASYAVELHARDRNLDNAAKCFPNLQQQIRSLETALRSFRDGR